MRAASLDTAVTLCLGIVLLLVLILVQQAAHRVRRRSNNVLRPAFELAIAEYLGEESAPGPPPPKGRREQAVFRQVALAALVELRGQERTRLTELLERTGIVTRTVAELGSRRRLTRRRAADMLAEIQSVEEKPALLAGLEDADRAVRLGCARALAELGDEPSALLVLGVAEAEVDFSPGAVTDVLLALAASKPSLLADALGTTTSSPLRRILAAILGEFRLAEYAPLLRGLLADEDEEVVARAARGLGLIGDHESVYGLVGVLGDDARSDRVKASAAAALGWIGDAAATAPLQAARSSGGWIVETAAAQALALLGEQGGEALGRAASGERPAPRAQALVALER
jgi:HEAT repeat protein